MAAKKSKKELPAPGFEPVTSEVNEILYDKKIKLILLNFGNGYEKN